MMENGDLPDRMFEWMPSVELRFVRRKVYFEGGAEPAFRLVLQQLWLKYAMVEDEGIAEFEEWRDVPTVNEPDPVPLAQGISLADVAAAA